VVVQRPDHKLAAAKGVAVVVVQRLDRKQVAATEVEEEEEEVVVAMSYCLPCPRAGFLALLLPPLIGA
jgi:hypothetical protein